MHRTGRDIAAVADAGLATVASAVLRARWLRSHASTEVSQTAETGRRAKLVDAVVAIRICRSSWPRTEQERVSGQTTRFGGTAWARQCTTNCIQRHAGKKLAHFNEWCEGQCLTYPPEESSELRWVWLCERIAARSPPITPKSVARLLPLSWFPELLGSWGLL